MTLDDFHAEKDGEVVKIGSTEEAHRWEQNAEVLLNEKQLSCFFSVIPIVCVALFVRVYCPRSKTCGLCCLFLCGGHRDDLASQRSQEKRRLNRVIPSII